MGGVFNMIFPLTGTRFEHQFGIRALPATESIFLRSDRFIDETAEKKRLINDDHSNYVAALPAAEPAMLETVNMIRTHAGSQTMKVADQSASGNEIESVKEFKDAALLVQEDLVICSGDPGSGFPMVAGVVCFPSGWTIAEKIGMPIHAIHAPVPQFAETMGRSTSALLDRLRTGRPVWRTNWGVRCSGRLDQSPKHAEREERCAQTIDQSNAGARCYFRVERQTLSRLPVTDDILFTIHTMQTPIDQLTGDQQQTLLAWLETCPAETLRYKGITPFYESLKRWLLDLND